MPNMLIGVAVAVAGFIQGNIVSATAQSYPERTLKVIVAGVAGSPVYILTRMIADKLSARLAQPIVVENRTGAAGNLGAEAVAKATPDGYTLLVVLDTTLTVNPSLYQKLPFDPERDFRPISI